MADQSRFGVWSRRGICLHLALQYGLPLALLLLTIAAFLLAARGEYQQFGWLQVAMRIIVALPLVFSGIVLHFLRPGATAGIIPPGFPDPALLVLLSGVLEVAGAIALFIPSVRRAAGVLVALLLVAIFPANIYAAGKIVAGVQMPGIAVRTAMQLLYILLVLASSFGLPRVGRSKRLA